MSVVCPVAKVAHIVNFKPKIQALFNDFHRTFQAPRQWKSTLQGRNEAQRAEARKAEPGLPDSWRGLTAPPQQLGGLEEHCKLPSGVWGTAPAANAFLWYCKPMKCIWR